ncbi:PAS domain S-box protein [candidate division KSB1 bacterium]
MAKPSYEELEKRVKKLEKAEDELKRIEETLKTSQERYKLATKAANVGVWDWNIVTNEFYLDPNIKAILGYSHEEIPNDIAIWVTYVHPDDSEAVMKSAQDCIDGKTPEYIYEHRMIHKDGSVRWILVRGNVIRDKNGNAVRMLGTDTDITDRKKAEEALRKSEEQYSNLVKSSQDMIFSIDRDGIYHTAEGARLREFGFKSEDVVGKSIFDLFPKEVAEKGHKRHLKVFNEGKSITFEQAYKFGNLKKTDHITLYPIEDKSGNIELVGIICRDITEQKQTEHELQASERNYQEIFDASNDGIIIHDMNTGAIMDVNRRACEMFGYTYDEILKTTVGKLSLGEPPYSQEDAIKKIKETVEKGSINFEWLCRRKNGETFWIEVNLKIITFSGSEYIMAVDHDITERKKTEKMLLEYQKAVESSEDYIVSIDPEYRYIFANKAFLKLRNKTWDEVVGHTAEEVLGKKLFKKYFKKPIDETLRGNTLRYEVEMEYPGLGMRNIMITTCPVLDNNNNITGMVGINRDITERKKAEEKLRESEYLLNQIFNNIPNIVFVKDGNGNFIMGNKAMAELYKTTPDKLIGKSQLDFVDTLNLDAAEIKNYIADDKKIIRSKKIKIIPNELFTIGDSKRIYQTVKIPLTLAGNQDYVLGVSTDITEQKMLEEQLFQSQKMESIGRLAGGIAHDFNNILTAIMGYADLLKHGFGDTPASRENAVDIILSNAERASDLTRQLLGFARGGKYNPVIININETIKETVGVSEKIFEKSIKVKYKLDKNINNIEADKSQINQVLTNIIINAKDAMPKGGELILKTENVSIDSKYAKIYTGFKEGDYIKISITDTGIGMSKSVMDRIFEPFYTTKGNSKGTGLGLATVYGIIKNHNGYINCSSKPGKGTSFTIYLPVSEKEIALKIKEKKAIAGNEIILVVDDESNVRQVVELQLKKLGYEVLTAVDGVDAIKIYKKKKDKIDLILLDMIMPNMAGKETYLKLKDINPDVKVLLMSGFSQNGKAAEILNEGISGFLHKPFKLYELSKIISETLKK